MPKDRYVIVPQSLYLYILMIANILVDRRGWSLCRLRTDNLACSWTNPERQRIGFDLLVTLREDLNTLAVIIFSVIYALLLIAHFLPAA